MSATPKKIKILAVSSEKRCHWEILSAKLLKGQRKSSGGLAHLQKAFPGYNNWTIGRELLPLLPAERQRESSHCSWNSQVQTLRFGCGLGDHCFHQHPTTLSRLVTEPWNTDLAIVTSTASWGLWNCHWIHKTQKTQGLPCSFSTARERSKLSLYCFLYLSEVLLVIAYPDSRCRRPWGKCRLCGTGKTTRKILKRIRNKTVHRNHHSDLI